MASFYQPVGEFDNSGLAALNTAKKIAEEYKQNVLLGTRNSNKTIAEANRKIAKEKGWMEDNPDTLSNYANGLDDMRKAVATTTAKIKPYVDTEDDPSKIKENVLHKGDLGYNEQLNASRTAGDDYVSRLARKGYFEGEDGNLYKGTGWDANKKAFTGRELYATKTGFVSQKAADEYSQAEKDIAAAKGRGLDQKAFDAQQKADDTAEAVVQREIYDPATTEKELKIRMERVNKDQAAADKAKSDVTALGDNNGDLADRAAISARKDQDTKDAQNMAASAYRQKVAEGVDPGEVYRRAWNETGNAQEAYAIGRDFLIKNGASAEAMQSFQNRFERQNLVGEPGVYIGAAEDLSAVHKGTRAAKPVVSKVSNMTDNFNYISDQPIQQDFADGVRSKEAWVKFVKNLATAKGVPGSKMEQEWLSDFSLTPDEKAKKYSSILKSAVIESAPQQMSDTSVMQISPEIEKEAAALGRNDIYAYAEEKRKADAEWDKADKPWFGREEAKKKFYADRGLAVPPL